MAMHIMEETARLRASYMLSCPRELFVGFEPPLRATSRTVVSVCD